MKKVHIVPVLVVVLFAAACGDGPTAVAGPAKVRFFNAVWGTQDNIGFTTNTQFATGSALAYLQSTQTCSTLDAGNTTFGIGLANASGTALNSNTFVTLDNQTITDGGNYTVLAGGAVQHPSVVLLDNSFSGTLGANQAAVRFVNLAPGTETAPNNYAAFIGTFGADGTLAGNNIELGVPTTFTTVVSGSNAFSVLRNHEVPPAVTGTPGTLNLQGGSVNTLAIVPNASGGFQLVNLPRCS